MKKIKLKLIGGLGNQLFQYATAYTLAKKYKAVIELDVSVYKKYRIRKCNVKALPISELIQSVHTETTSISDRIAEIVFRFVQKIVKITKKSIDSGEWLTRMFEKSGRHYNFDPYYYEIKGVKQENKLFGYYQSEKYFLEFKEEVKNILTPRLSPESHKKISAYLNDLEISNSAAVSIRCGDDYKICGLYKCKQEYYDRGLDLLNKYCDIKKVYVFTDDIPQAKKDFHFEDPVVYVEGLDEFESLYLMSLFQNYVIANSSFSWWGAYLSQSNRKMVVAPSDWYNDNSNIEDIYWNECVVI